MVIESTVIRKTNSRKFQTFFYNSFSIEKKNRLNNPFCDKRRASSYCYYVVCSPCLSFASLCYLSSIPCLASGQERASLVMHQSRKIGWFVFFFRLKTNSKRKLGILLCPKQHTTTFHTHTATKRRGVDTFWLSTRWPINVYVDSNSRNLWTRRYKTWLFLKWLMNTSPTKHLVADSLVLEYYWYGVRVSPASWITLLQYDE